MIPVYSWSLPKQVHLGWPSLSSEGFCMLAFKMQTNLHAMSILSASLLSTEKSVMPSLRWNVLSTHLVKNVFQTQESRDWFMFQEWEVNNLPTLHIAHSQEKQLDTYTTRVFSHERYACHLKLTSTHRYFHQMLRKQKLHSECWWDDSLLLRAMSLLTRTGWLDHSTFKTLLLQTEAPKNIYVSFLILVWKGMPRFLQNESFDKLKLCILGFIYGLLKCLGVAILFEDMLNYMYGIRGKIFAASSRSISLLFMRQLCVICRSGDLPSEWLVHVTPQRLARSIP